MKRTSTSFALPIWKLLFDAYTQAWFVVCKNAETKATEVYGLTDGKSSLLFTTDFWTGISDCNYGRLVVHGFVAPDRPEPMGIEVFDGKSGQRIWRRPELIFQEVLDRDRALAIARNHETVHYVVLDMKSGETLATYENREDAAAFHVDAVQEILQPLVSIYREGEEDFELVKQFIQEKEQKSIAGLVEYLETNGLIVISYYIRASNGFINECSLFDLEGQLLSKEVLAAKADQLALNTFMVQGQSVVLIKERKELVFYEI